MFGNPSKEEELSKELQALEEAMAAIEGKGGRLSLDDVQLEVRELSQTQVEPGIQEKTDSEDIRAAEGMLLRGELEDGEERSKVFYNVLIYHLQQRNFQRLEYWLLDGAQRGDSYCMKVLSEFYEDEVYGAVNPERHFYWMKQGAEAGNKDCLFKMGQYYAQQGTDHYRPAEAAVCFVKAADEEHQEAYLHAFVMFYTQKDYVRGEICLKAGYEAGVPGAAYRLALIYDVEDNPTGKRDTEKALYWFEEAYRTAPDGDVCFGLGNLYVELGQTEKGLAILRQGVGEYQSEDCSRALEEMDEQ